MKYILLLLLLFPVSVVAQKHFTVYFDTDKDVPADNSLKQLHQFLAQNKGLAVTAISGYADYRGASDYNQRLSQRRAKAVAKVLEADGVVLGSAVVAGQGETDNGDLAGNRKVTVIFEEGQEPEIVKDEAPEVQPSLARSVSAARKGDRLILKNVYFYNLSSEVLPSSKPVLQELLKIMQDNPGLKIEIQGHICCQKYDVSNVSAKRAKTVYDYLISGGIAKERLSYNGFGSKKPKYRLPERTEEERVANRRVEIEILEN